MFLARVAPSLDFFLVLLLKLVKYFFKVPWQTALVPLSRFEHLKADPCQRLISSEWSSSEFLWRECAVGISSCNCCNAESILAKFLARRDMPRLYGTRREENCTFPAHRSGS